MEQQPTPEPTVQYPYSFFLITFEDGSKSTVFSTNHLGTLAENQEGAVKKADSLLSANSNRDSVIVSPHFTRARGSNEIRTVRDTTIRN